MYPVEYKVSVENVSFGTVLFGHQNLLNIGSNYIR